MVLCRNRSRLIRCLLLALAVGGSPRAGSALRGKGVQNRTGASTGEHATAAGVTAVRLPNGLTVLLKEVHSAPVVCTYVWYRVGSRNELPGITGISHQIEHMMFKGTRKQFPYPGYIDLLIGRNGGSNNAQTGSDATSYYLLLPSEKLELALQIEADRMTEAAIEPAQLAAEKRVVLSELEGGENDDASFLYDNTRAAAYRYHSYHYPVIGTKWDVQRYTRAQVYSFYRKHYLPDNAVLVIVGDFHTAETLKRVRTLWKGIPAQPLPQERPAPEPAQRGERRIQVRRAGTIPYLSILYHIPPAVHADMPALTLLATVLTSGRSSRLYRALVETRLAASVSATANQGIDPETFDIGVTVRSGIPPEQAEQALHDAIEHLQTELIPERELQKARNQTRAAFLFAQESVLSQASRLGFYQTVTGDWRNLNRFLPDIDAVTADTVRRVARTYLTRDNRTVGVFVPQEEENGTKRVTDSGGPALRTDCTILEPPQRPSPDGGGATSGRHASAGSASHRQSAAAPSGSERAIRPSAQHRRLANGLTVIVQENHATPTIALHGFLRAGSVDDPSDRQGLAATTAALLTRGAGRRTAQQVADEMDFVGATLSASASRERTDIRSSMLRDDFDRMLDLLADAIRRPNFPAAELERVRSETLTTLNEEANDTATVALRRLYSALYPDGHPYRHSPNGSLEHIARITREDLVRFHAGYFQPDRITLVIVGDVRSQQALQAIEQRFGDWQASPNAPESAAGQPATRTALRTGELVHVPLRDKSQDDVALGLLGPSRSSRDYEAASLLNLLFGGDPFVGRVGKRVRDTEGLAYYAYTALTPSLTPGPWIFRAGANPKNVGQVLRSVRAEFTRLLRDGVTPGEVAWSQDHAIGAMRISLATNSGVADMLIDAAFFGLGQDYLARYGHRVRSLTPEQLNAVARSYFVPDALRVVIAGPPPDLDKKRAPTTP